jgi:hypothetical protein
MKSILSASICLWLAGALPSAAVTRSAAEGDFDPRVATMERSETLFMEHLFELLDDVVEANRAVARWFVSGGSEGLHVEDYRASVDGVLAGIESLRAPERLEEVRGLLAAAVRAQQAFFTDWYAALEQGRSFDSQLTSEFGYHEGLHVSQRKLLDAYGRLLALFPREGDGNRRSFHHQVCRLDLACAGVVR